MVFNPAFSRWEHTSEVQKLEIICKQMIAVLSTKSIHVTSVPLREKKTVKAGWYINLSAQGIRGLDRAHAAQTPAPPRAGLPGQKSPAAGHPAPVFPWLSPLSFIYVRSNDATIGVEDDRTFVEGLISHTPAQATWSAAYGHMIWRNDQASACWWGAFSKTLDQAGNL